LNLSLGCSEQERSQISASMFTLSVSEEFTGTRNARDPPPPLFPARNTARTGALTHSPNPRMQSRSSLYIKLRLSRRDGRTLSCRSLTSQIYASSRGRDSGFLLSSSSLSLSLSLFLISLGVAETVLELDIYYIRHSVFRLETSFFPRGPMR